MLKTTRNELQADSASLLGKITNTVLCMKSQREEQQNCTCQERITRWHCYLENCFHLWDISHLLRLAQNVSISRKCFCPPCIPRCIVQPSNKGKNHNLKTHLKVPSKNSGDINWVNQLYFIGKGPLVLCVCTWLCTYTYYIICYTYAWTFICTVNLHESVCPFFHMYMYLILIPNFWF